MTIKERISMTTFQKLKKMFPEEELLQMYKPMPDEEFKEWQEYVENFRIPDFLKPKKDTL